MNDNEVILACIPLYLKKTPPDGKANCTIVHCEKCNEKMWLTEKKKAIKEKNKDLKIWCMTCCVIEYGKDGEFLDISKVN